MKVELEYSSSLVNVFNEPQQIITMDANFLICPNRKGTNFPFEKFSEIWLDPIFEAFPNLAIHEAVYEELVDKNSKNYIDSKPNLIIHKDSSLTAAESRLRNTVEEKISVNTEYCVELDNKDDRGEVKSLAFIAVKDYLYFASNDYNAIKLVEKSEEWQTGLDNIRAIKMYELIYYLYKTQLSNSKGLRILYKYQYFLSKREKTINPCWGDFINKMDEIYNSVPKK
jgi:rRNA-processing protein FCF1